MNTTFIDNFISLLATGRQNFLSSLLQGSQSNNLSTVAIQNLINAPLTPLTQLGDNLTSPLAYNLSLNTIAADLSSLYTESGNIWNIFSSIQYLTSQDITNLILSISTLEAKVSQAISTSFFSGITFTNNVSCIFNQQTIVENDPQFYQSGSIPQAFIDTNDNLLVLPINGEFLNELSSTNQIPNNVYMDRVIGIPVAKGNTANYAFDGSLINYWNEVIHSNAPLYVDNFIYPWLPVVSNSSDGYRGGAACRLKIEFETITQVSELDIKIFGSTPINLLSFGWTSQQNNLLVDPNFVSGLSSSYWSTDSSVFGDINTGGVNLITGGGPNGENAVNLFTYSSTGSIFLVHNAFNISNTQGIEVSFLAQSIDNTPILISLNSISSGGVTLSTATKTIYLNSTSWTEVSISFDQVPGTTACLLKFGIPPYFETSSSIIITAPFVEGINQFTYYENILNRSTVFLDYPVSAKNVYLVFSQENYIFKHYSISDIQNIDKANWNRLTKPNNPKVLNWTQELSRGGNLKLLELSSYNDSSLDYIRQIPGTSWEKLSEIVQYANPDISQSSFAVYEYQIGAFEIYLKHREYNSNGRFVSAPLQLNGELREISLQAIDSVTDNITAPNTINYTLTVNENDLPEYGKTLLNSNIYSSDYSTSFPTPPSTIPYLDYTTWSYGSPDFQAIYWQYAQQATQTANVLLVNIGPTAYAGEFIQKVLSSPIDLRGASSVTAQYFALASQVLNNSLIFNFMFGISSDGVNWIEQTYEAPISNQYDIDGSSDQLIFYPLLLNLTSIPSDQLESIQYLRITCTTPTFYPSSVWLMFSNLSTETMSSGGRTLRFFPSDDITTTLNPITDFMCPIRNITDIVNGSDRYGRVNLSYYPYINKNTILSLIWGGSNSVPSLSANLNGLRVPYDPNALNPKWLDDSGIVSTLNGYRPITVTIQFTTTNQIVGPDALGKPLPGELFQSVNEQLTLASSTTSSTFIAQNTSVTTQPTTQPKIGIFGKIIPNLTQNQGAISSNNQINTQRTRQVWQTQYTNLITGPNGIDFTASWSNGTATGTVNIDPLLLSVDAINGLVTVSQNAPGSGYFVVASYWFIIGEASPRENFFGTTTVSGNVQLNSPQQYPVTRNMTDYMTGIIPILTPAQLDPLSDNYYPVYEYYIHPDGYLVFSQSLMEYSDTPAIINVNYNTLAIVPRLIIDLNRPNFTNQTPYCSNYILLANTRQN